MVAFVPDGSCLFSLAQAFTPGTKDADDVSISLFRRIKGRKREIEGDFFLLLSQA
jgi:hypothetical protein